MATSAAKLRRLGSTRETDEGMVSDDKTYTIHQCNPVHTAYMRNTLRNMFDILNNNFRKQVLFLLKLH